MMVAGVCFVLFGYSDIGQSRTVINLQSNLAGVGLFISGSVLVGAGATVEAIRKSSLGQVAKAAATPSLGDNSDAETFPTMLSEDTKALLEKAKSLQIRIEIEGKKVLVVTSEGTKFTYSEKELRDALDYTVNRALTKREVSQDRKA
jgi:hypothetical protein